HPRRLPASVTSTEPRPSGSGPKSPGRLEAPSPSRNPGPPAYGRGTMLALQSGRTWICSCKGSGMRIVLVLLVTLLPFCMRADVAAPRPLDLSELRLPPSFEISIYAGDLRTP